MKKKFTLSTIIIALILTSMMTSAQNYNRELQFSDSIKEGQEFKWKVDTLVWNITDNSGLEADQATTSTVTTTVSTSTSYQTTTESTIYSTTTAYTSTAYTTTYTETDVATETVSDDGPQFDEGAIFEIDVITTPTDLVMQYNYVEEEDYAYYESDGSIDFSPYFVSKHDGIVTSSENGGEIFPIDLFLIPNKLKVDGIEHNIFNYAVETGEFFQDFGDSDTSKFEISGQIFTFSDDIFEEDFLNGTVQIQYDYESGVLLRFYQDIKGQGINVQLDINLLTSEGLDLGDIIDNEGPVLLPWNLSIIYSTLFVIIIIYRKRK